MTTRREFVATTALAAGALAVGRPKDAAAHSRLVPHVQDRMDAPTRELLLLALDTAKRAGASYADARIQRVQRNAVFTRERQVLDVIDSDTMGCGIRALVDGCWGFAATPRLTNDGIQRAATEAVATAKANRVARDRPVVLAPNPSHPDATWSSGFTIDPFTISIEEKTTLALAANAAALTVPGVRFVSTQLNFVKEERNYANTDGSVIAQTLVRTYTPIAITAVSADRSDFAIRDAVVQPTGRGWESVLENTLVVNAKKWAEEAAEKLTAKSIEPGRLSCRRHAIGNGARCRRARGRALGRIVQAAVHWRRGATGAERGPHGHHRLSGGGHRRRQTYLSHAGRATPLE